MRRRSSSVLEHTILPLAEVATTPPELRAHPPGSAPCDAHVWAGDLLHLQCGVSIVVGAGSKLPQVAEKLMPASSVFVMASVRDQATTVSCAAGRASSGVTTRAKLRQ